MNETPMNMTDYEQARRQFSLVVPRHFNYTRDVIEVWASKDPSKLALLSVGPTGENELRLSFSQLAARARRAANFLAGIGVRKGDRIFVMLPRRVAWYEALLGAFHLGAVPMPGTVQLTARDVAHRIQRASASTVIVDEEGAAKVESVRNECGSLTRLIVVGEEVPSGWQSWDTGLASASEERPHVQPTEASDPLLLYFTSGTTGYPKMVLHTHASYGIGHEVTARFWQDLKPDDLHWTVSDTGWAKAAWGKLFGQWRIGAANFLWDGRGKPDFELMLRLIERHRITTFCAPPTIYRHFVTMDLTTTDLTSLRHVVAAGEPLNPETFNAWKEATGTEIHDGYGQTETCNVVANFRCLPKRPGSMGRPVPGYDVAIVDDHGSMLDPGTDGNIAIRIRPERPVGLFQEYWRDDEATAAAFRGDWYHTGDRARVDDEGYLWFSARADDVIISSGYRIGPFEVESVIMEHPAIAETAVIGVADDQRGEVVKAFIVLKPGESPSDALAQEIQTFAKRQTAPYKYPRLIEFLPELPKTVSGKIRRVELRDRAAQ